MAVHEDVITIPVAAVIETDEGDFCWIKTSQGTEGRLLQLGDSNDVFIVVNGGVKEGDEVILNPAAFVKEAESNALVTLDEDPSQDSDAGQESRNAE